MGLTKLVSLYQEVSVAQSLTPINPKHPGIALVKAGTSKTGRCNRKENRKPPDAGRKGDGMTGIKNKVGRSDCNICGTQDHSKVSYPYANNN